MTGAVIALLVKEPAIAIPLSFISHFMCDVIPHFGVIDNPGQPDDELFKKKFNIILALDFLAAVGLMIVLGKLFPAQKQLIWICMIAAAIPDLASAYYRLYIEKIKKQPRHHSIITRFLYGIQTSETYKGAFVEVAWFLVMGAIILGQR